MSFMVLLIRKQYPQTFAKKVKINMYEILDKINSSKDLKKLSKNELVLLCGEIRDFLIDNVTKTGGHLASNLGVVELTVALHLIYDFPTDKLIWDVGHQSYVHKILTGRKDRFNTLRQFNGLSGFPKRCESEYDCFNTGHSSTSVSAALGMARARDLNNENYHVAAVFGDGAMTGGMIYEAINDAGHRKTPLLLILNDNEMSISKNVGALSKYLRRLRQTPGYHRSKKRVERFLGKIPLLGEPLKHLLQKMKTAIRTNILPSTLFDDLGIEYLGPIDGHNITELTKVLNFAKNMEYPVIVHVITKKGKGYPPAEINPQNYHGISPCNAKTGINSIYKDYSQCAGKTLVRLAEKNSKFVTITAAMPAGVGLTEFSVKYPKRFFDVGIAEEHAVTFSAGLAVSGIVPVFAVYSSFLQRSYDQILHDVCLQGLHVVFLIDRAGAVGADGETHHGLYDISFLRNLPSMTILSPSSFEELEKMIYYAVNIHNGPIAIRYPRGNICANISGSFEYGKCKPIGQSGENIIITSGRTVKTALDAVDILKSVNIDVSVITLPTISPLPKDLTEILSYAKKIVTLEDHSVGGGIGEAVGGLIARLGLNVNFASIAYPNEPIVHGTVDELDKKYGLDANSVAECLKNI